MVGARLAVWIDKEGLRIGDRWNSKIEAVLRTCHILIVRLTPRWIDSVICRKEYSIFEEVEQSRKIDDYVTPLLVRTVERQEKHFTEEQRDIYGRIKPRQYQKVLATDFLKLNRADQTVIIDKVADDIEGMIERLRKLPPLVRTARDLA